MVVIPVLVAYVILRIVDRYLPESFLRLHLRRRLPRCGALAVLATGASARRCCCWLAGVYDADYLIGEYLPYFVLLAFSEAWISGMAITLMVVYRPALGRHLRRPALPVEQVNSRRWRSLSMEWSENSMSPTLPRYAT